MGILQKSSLIVTPNAKKAGKLYSVVPTDGTGDLDVVRATTATYVGSDGLIKTALANEPRFDYSNGNCPSILVEPQRTNLVVWSDMFTISTWTKTSLNVNENTTISPNGTQDADTITTISTFNNIYQTLTVTANTVYTFSFYVLRGSMTDLKYSVFNLSGLSNIIAPTSYYSQTSSSTWVRISLTFTTPVGCTSINIYPIRDTGVTGTVFLWGAQLEQGSNATSYIPTTTTSVTRNADVISKSGISDLIGQTDGTLFLDASSFNFLGTGFGERISFTDGTFNNRVSIDLQPSTAVTLVASNSTLGLTGTITSTNGLISPNNRFKIAIAYNGINSVLYINGVVFTNIIGTIPTFSGQLNTIEFNQGNGARPFYGKINSVLSFKTRLSNIELQELTTL